MLREAARSSAPALVLPLMAGALLGGCGQEPEPVRNVAAAPPEQPKALSPTEAAEQKVTARLGNPAVRFADARVFDSQGATIVCGRVLQDGQADQRYIAVGEEDVFVESQMAPGEMERAVAETCKGGNAR